MQTSLPFASGEVASCVACVASGVFHQIAFYVVEAVEDFLFFRRIKHRGQGLGKAPQRDPGKISMGIREGYARPHKIQKVGIELPSYGNT